MLQRNEREAEPPSSELLDASLAALIMVILGLLAAISALRSPADVHLTSEQIGHASESRASQANRISARNEPASGGRIRKRKSTATDAAF
jgi:hypothetical protein